MTKSAQDKELVQLFISDSTDAISKLEDDLLQLENNTDTEVINELFRAAHSIKGGASLLGYESMATLAHAMENLLDLIREGQVTVERRHIDALLEGVDLIKQHLHMPWTDFNIADLLSRLECSSSKEHEEPATAGADCEDDISMLLQMSEDLKTQATPSPKISEKPKEKKEHKSDEKKEKSSLKISNSNETIKVNVIKLNKLVNLAEELVLARNQLLSASSATKFAAHGIQNILQNVNLVTTDMQTEIMSMRMQPMSLVFNKFPRLVRDLSLKLGKKIKVEIEGDAVELDKTIIEAISDPLNHLVRNAVDHAIESPEERTSLGKRPEATITLKAFHAGGLVHIEIIDDGRGIDANKIAAKAVQKGLILEDQANLLTNEEKIKFIFAPGFSTAEKVTDTSGRGVGMDVVQTNIKKLDGTVDVETEVGSGSRIKITLPLTLAIISSLIVEIENIKFAIPQVSFEELIQVAHDEIDTTIANIQGGQVVRLRGALLPLMHLADCISLERKFTHPQSGEILLEKRKNYSNISILDDGTEVPNKISYSSMRTEKPPSLKILVLTTGANRFAVIVDKIFGFEEIIVKSLPAHLRQLSTFAGVTILGDGKVALIVDIFGIANKNALVFEKTEDIQKHILRPDNQEAETVSLLIFDNFGPEQFAIPVSLIKRVDKIHRSEIQTIGEKQFINYMNETTRILKLEDFIQLPPYEKKQVKCPDDVMLLIPKNLKIPIGIEIGNVIEIKEIPVIIEDNSLKTNFLLGSIIINKKITLLLDLYNILEENEPGCFATKELVNNRKKKKFKILLAEDTPFYKKIATDHLTNDGYEVVSGCNGLEAWEILNNVDGIDAIVTDIEMPVMNGYEFSEHIRASEKFKHLPIVALTFLSSEKAKSKGMKIGIDKWLVKIDKVILLNTLHELLNKNNFG